MTDLEGRELDEALARAMGWTHVRGYEWADAELNDHVFMLDTYHEDVTALLRDIEPVCRERGMVDWSVSTGEDEDRDGYKAFALCGEDDYFVSVVGYGTAATALARAFLAVLERDR